MLDAYLATNALYGSVHDMEDLLNERQSRAIHSQVGQSLIMDEDFHRQIKKAKMLSHDIAIYERALDGSKEKSFILV